MPPSSTQLIRYPNGFQLLFVPSRSAPVVALDLWVRVGSACEALEEAGMAHLVEHMLFKGTDRRPPGAIAREVEGLGGEINAYTSFDHTVYTLVMASRYAEQGLDILADAVFHSSFDPRELDREKGVVLEEIKRGRDLPHHYLSRLLFSQVFTVHPYGRAVIGDEATVSAFDRGRCLSFVERWYRPGSMTLVVAGDADLPRLVQWVRATFGRRSGPSRPPRRLRVREPRREGFRTAMEPRDVTECYFDIAFPGPAANQPEIPALDVLTAILGQGEASRLQHRVKLDLNLVRSVGAGAYTPRDPGLIYVGGVAEPEQMETAYSAICEEIFRLCHEPVGVKELQRAKENIEADFVYQRETVQGQAQKAGYFQVVLGDVRREDQYLEAMRRVDAEAVREVARRRLRSRHALLALLHPRTVSAPVTGSRAGEIMAGLERGARPPVHSLRRRGGALSRRVLPNGARVIVKVNPEVPIVALRAAFLGGSRREAQAEAGAFHLAANCLVRGTRSRNVFDIAHEADALSGQLEGFSGRNSFGVKGEFLAKYLEDGLDLFAELLCHPTFPDEEVDKVRQDTLGALRLRRDNPGAYAFRLFEQTLYGDHPFGWDVLGSPESVARIRAPDLRRVFAAYSRPADLAVAVVGDVIPDQVHEFFARALEHLEPGGPLPPPPPAPMHPGSPRLHRESVPIEQAHVVAGFLGAKIADSERFALRVANGLLSGQGGRLFRRLRDDLGLAYAVTSHCVEGLDPGYIAAYIATRPDAAETAREGLLEEFSRLAEGDVSAEEVEEAKSKLVGGFEISLQENAFQAAQMALDEIYGLGYRSFESWARSLLAVTRADTIEAARRHFDPDRSVCVILDPAPGA